MHAHGEKFAVLVERQFSLGQVIAAVRVGEERVGALTSPFDRAIHPLGCPGNDGFLGIQINFGTKAAADIGRDHAHLVFGQSQHKSRHQQALHVRILAGDMQRIRIVAACILRKRRARFDGVGDQTVVGELQRGHVFG